MALVEDDLGGDVLGGAAERPRLAPHSDPLREPEVHHLQRIYSSNLAPKSARKKIHRQKSGLNRAYLVRHFTKKIAERCLTWLNPVQIGQKQLNYFNFLVFTHRVTIGVAS